MTGWIKVPLGAKVGLGPGHIVLHGDPAHQQRGTAPPPIICCRKMAGWIKMSLGREVDLPKRGQSPEFSAHLYCSQTAGWIKVQLGAKVGLGSSHIV